MLRSNSALRVKLLSPPGFKLVIGFYKCDWEKNLPLKSYGCIIGQNDYENEGGNAKIHI